MEARLVTDARGNLAAKILGALRGGSLMSFARRQWLWLYNLPRFSWPIWFNVVNKRARVHYRDHGSPLSPVQERAVRELRQHGITVLNFGELFPEQALADYCALGERVVQQPHNRQAIADQRTKMSEKVHDRQKYYFLSLWEKGVLDLGNPFVRFSLSDEILGIVNGYLEMSARLINVDLWYHLPMRGPNLASQNWHRDPTDRKVLKVFFYLRDVDESSGPFQFVLGSHEVGPFGKIFPRKLPAGVYPPADAVEKKFSDMQRRHYTGKAGTIVIVDTSGLHRGGHVLDRDRYLYHTYFLTDGAYDLDQFVKLYGYHIKPQNGVQLSPAADYAIGMWKAGRRA
jgi:hypothetical protein